MKLFVKFLIIFVVNFSIARCAYTVDGYWEYAHSGNRPAGAFLAHSRGSELYYICRGKTDHGTMPGVHAPDGQCYIPAWGQRLTNSYEVLVQRHGISYYWEYNEEGRYNDNAVNGGWQDDVRLLICRFRTKSVEEDPVGRGSLVWVTGKLHPKDQKCYVPYHGERHSYTYEVLMARTD